MWTLNLKNTNKETNSQKNYLCLNVKKKPKSVKCLENQQ